MNKLMWMTAACLAVALWCTVSSAVLSVGQEQSAQALIKDFTAKEFAARQQAVEKLIALGPDVVPLIRKTMAGTEDAEVKLRCQMVLKGVTDKYGVTATAPAPAEAKPALGASKISIDVKDTPLDEVMQKLADGSGNSLIKTPADLAEKTVTLKMKDATYWQVLDKVCEQVGAIYQPDYSSGKGGITLAAAAKAKDIGGSSGPVSVKVNTMNKMCMLRPWAAGVQLTNNVECQLIFFWEDRIPVISVDGQVTQATLPDGRVLAQVPQPMILRTMQMGGGQKQSFGNLFYRAADLAEGAKKLSLLEGVVKLTTAVGPDKEIKVDDVLGEGDKTAQADGLTLAVTREKNANPGLVQLKVKATRDGKPAEVPIEQLGERYGAFLIDPAGARHPARSISGNPPNPGQPVTLTFPNPPQLDGKWSLLVVYPGNTETKEYPFKIENIPVP